MDNSQLCMCKQIPQAAEPGRAGVPFSAAAEALKIGEEEEKPRKQPSKYCYRWAGTQQMDCTGDDRPEEEGRST